MHQLPLLTRLGELAIIGDDEDLGHGNRAPHRGRMFVDKFRIEISRAEGFGQAIHGKKLALREHASKIFDEIGGQGPTRIGQAPHRPDRFGGPVDLGQLHPQRGHGRQRRDPMPGAGLSDVAREQIVERHDAAARVPGR